MAIKNGETANADEVLNLVGITFKNQAQLLYNAAYIGFNSKLNVATGVPNLKNVKYDVFNSDTATTKTNFRLLEGKNCYVSLSLSDLSIDTTYDPNSASNPNNFFDGNAETYAEVKTGQSNDSSASLGKTFSSRYIGNVYINASVSHSGGRNTRSSSISLYTYNGSSWVLETTLASTTGASASFNGSYVIDKVVQGVTVSTATNAQSAFDSSSHKFNELSYDSLADGNSTLIFQTTSLPTIKDCIPTWNASIDSENTLTVSISADGTNYETVTDATIHRFTNTGTNLYIKFEIDRVDTSAVDKISEYAILYNVGG